MAQLALHRSSNPRWQTDGEGKQSAGNTLLASATKLHTLPPLHTPPPASIARLRQSLSEDPGSAGPSAIMLKCESGKGVMYAFLQCATALLRKALSPSPTGPKSIGPLLLPSSSYSFPLT